MNEVTRLLTRLENIMWLMDREPWLALVSALGLLLSLSLATALLVWKG